MADNRAKHTYYYKVSVYTGLRSGAGTSSKAFFVLNGETGDTGVRMLSDGKNKVRMVDVIWIISCHSRGRAQVENHDILCS